MDKDASRNEEFLYTELHVKPLVGLHSASLEGLCAASLEELSKVPSDGLHEAS